MADSTNLPLAMMDLVPSLDTPGFRLVDTGELFELLNTMLSITPNVVATGGAAKAASKQLVSATNVVLSANATNYGVILPPGLLGRQVIVINTAAVALNVWPFGTNDYILPAGSSTPAPNASQQAQTTAAYICIAKITNPTPITYWKQAAPV